MTPSCKCPLIWNTRSSQWAFWRNHELERPQWLQKFGFSVIKVKIFFGEMLPQTFPGYHVRKEKYFLLFFRGTNGSFRVKKGPARIIGKRTAARKLVGRD